MFKINVIPLSSTQVSTYRQGAPDAHGLPGEYHAKGAGPCRHCLGPIQAEEAMLVLAYSPFEERQPYAEVGPIFLHAQNCPEYSDINKLPEMFTQEAAQLIVKAYGDNNRIYYKACEVVSGGNLEECCHRFLEIPKVSYLHVRAAATNCYQFRVERADG